MTDARSETIGIRVTPSDNALIRRVAAAEGISITELMNRAWSEWFASYAGRTMPVQKP